MAGVSRERRLLSGPPPLPEPESFRDGDRRVLFDDIDPLKSRGPAGTLVGDRAMVRAVSRCETFHRRFKTATMADEKSFSHLFRYPNSFIPGGLSYGEALARKVIELGLVDAAVPHMVDVGDGLGDLAKNALPVLLGRWPGLTLSMVDLSPALLDAQRKALAEFGGRVDFINGNAENLVGVVGKAGFLLSNEVLADLTTITHIPRDEHEEFDLSLRNWFAKENSGWWAMAGYYQDKYGLEVNHNVFAAKGAVPALNYGAFRFVENLGQLLSPGGSALLIEYTSPNFVAEVRLRGHEEYSIHERNLVKVAEANGFRVSSGPLGQWLGIDRKLQYVDPNHVNIWLILGADPAEVASMGDAGDQMATDAAWKLVADSERRTLLDRALTREEFRVLAREKGWDIDADKLKTLNAAAKADNYTYFALTRK